MASFNNDLAVKVLLEVEAYKM